MEQRTGVAVGDASEPAQAAAQRAHALVPPALRQQPLLRARQPPVLASQIGLTIGHTEF